MNRTMLNTVLTILTAASMLACASQKNGSSSSKSSESNSSAMEVTLKVTITSNYCGGAPPSDEMIAKLKTPKTFQNQNFFISTKEALEDDMTEVKTSAAGVATLSLDKGTYYVYLPQKVTTKHTSKDRTEKECDQWKNTPNGTFTVGDNNSVSFNIHKTCDRCGALRM